MSVSEGWALAVEVTWSAWEKGLVWGEIRVDVRILGAKAEACKWF